MSQPPSHHLKSASLDVRKDFPIFGQQVHGLPLVFLDSGASTQKPRVVIDAMTRYYETTHANIHRGNYQLSLDATRAYEDARATVARFLNVNDPNEVLFTRGTTESINLVASSLGRLILQQGDEILLSELEHHSNIVPWQLIAEQRGAVIKAIPITNEGDLRYDLLTSLITRRTKIVAVTHVSNALGTIIDVKRIIEAAHAVGAAVLLDGAQWVAHHPTNLTELDVDFYAFSGHKLYGPTGIGVLYGKRRWLEAMPPYQGGGDMIKSVSFAGTTYAELPNKFEAGTPAIAEAVGLAAAIDYVQSIGLERITEQEHALVLYLEKRLREVPGLRIVGTAAKKSGAVSFVLEQPAITPYDLGIQLDLYGIAVRTGHHCCQPLMERLGLGATVRASLGIYNTIQDVDALVASLQKIRAKATTTIAIPLADEITYPGAYASSPGEAAKELLADFELFDSWNDRYQYLIDLGSKLPAFPESERTEYNRVHGCQSTVFLSARKRAGTRDTLDFVADSDADIVRGLIAVLERLFTGQKAADILAFDVDEFLAKLGLDKNLALTRRNGLASMISRIKTLATHIEKTCGDCHDC
jgi:cysteine desulfurase/selenocysteine lyase